MTGERPDSADGSTVAVSPNKKWSDLAGLAMRDADEHAEKHIEYEDFLTSKRALVQFSGFEVPDNKINQRLFPFQRDIVRWALRGGKRAVFAATGLGKTLIQAEWAHQVAKHKKGDVLILAPLAVALQTKELAAKFGIKINYCRKQSEVEKGINITNYDMLDAFDPASFVGVVCDESSVMKDWTAATTQKLRDGFANTKYKLCCTATPSPNDHTELGTHAEFLGIMTRMEMLSMYFCHDGGNTSEWRLKGHARKPFWRMLATWAVSLSRPSDLGYPDDGYDIPELRIIPHVVTVDHTVATEGMLFRCPDMSATGLHKEMRLTAQERAAKVAELIAAEPDEPWLILCNTDYEAQAIHKAIPGLTEVKGSQSVKIKEERLLGFTVGDPKDLLSKSSICGWGLNYQHCARLAIAGLSYSWEQFFQVIRRCWRYGQTREVFAHLVYAETEGRVYDVILKKQAKYEELQREMNEAMKEIQLEDRGKIKRSKPSLVSQKGEMWEVINADCVPTLATRPDNSVHYTIFSPPFASLYVYSDSDADMGNCKTEGEFFEHFAFLIKELHRVTMPGRLVSVHCMDLPTSMQHDGVIGLSDFSGDIIRAFKQAGFIYHSRVVIWKDPVTAMQRTKALGLLHKQVKKDSCRSRQGIPDYLITFRKAGDNPQPVDGMFDRYVGEEGTGPAPLGAPCSVCGGTKQVVSQDSDDFGEVYPCGACTSTTAETRFSIEVWQRYASPVWMDINPSDTLQRKSARQEQDERHIAPLQLQVIERGLDLWSNPGDIVLDPYAGIGSTGVVCARAGRRFLGIELKESYFQQAAANLKIADKSQSGLFASGTDQTESTTAE